MSIRFWSILLTIIQCLSLSFARQYVGHCSTASCVVRPRNLVNVHFRLIWIGDKLSNCFRNGGPVDGRNLKAGIIICGSLCEAVLNTRGRPSPHVLPPHFDLLNGLDDQSSVVLNRCPCSLVAVLDAVGRPGVSLAESEHDVVDRVLVVGRFDYEHGRFEVFSQIGRIVAVIVFLILLKALRHWKASATFQDQFKKTLCPRSDRFDASKGRKIFRNKQATVRKGVNLGCLCMLHEVVRVQVSGHSSGRDPSNHDSFPIIEVEFLIQEAELLQCVVVPSEVQLPVLVRDGLCPAARVLAAVAVDHENFGPIIEERVQRLLRGQDPSCIGICRRFGFFCGAESTKRALIATLQSFSQRIISAVAAAIEKDHEFVPVRT